MSTSYRVRSSSGTLSRPITRRSGSPGRWMTAHRLGLIVVELGWPETGAVAGDERRSSRVEPNAADPVSGRRRTTNGRPAGCGAGVALCVAVFLLVARALLGPAVRDSSGWVVRGRRSLLAAQHFLSTRLRLGGLTFVR